MKEPITVNGLTKLKEELVFLKEKKRPEIVSAISEARSHGDLKENAEYHAAKEQQSHNEGRIQQIEDIIARANVIDVTKIENLGKVIFGSTVYLKDLDSKEKLTYKIVGKDEADLKKNLIFFQSLTDFHQVLNFFLFTFEPLSLHLLVRAVNILETSPISGASTVMFLFTEDGSMSTCTL